MKRANVKKGTRVVFSEPDGIAPVYEGTNHALKSKTGVIVYGIGEDALCCPDDPASDVVWVAFDGARLPGRQVSAAWLDTVS